MYRVRGTPVIVCMLLIRCVYQLMHSDPPLYCPPLYRDPRLSPRNCQERISPLCVNSPIIIHSRLSPSATGFEKHLVQFY